MRESIIVFSSSNFDPLDPVNGGYVPLDPQALMRLFLAQQLRRPGAISV